MQTEDPHQARQVCSLAESQFDLKAMACGPTLSSGMGPRWNAERQLDSVLQELKRFPKMGWPLLASALQSPVVRNRQMAINALEAWSPDSLLLHRQYIDDCAKLEPHEEVQQRMKSLLVRLECELVTELNPSKAGFNSL